MKRRSLESTEDVCRRAGLDGRGLWMVKQPHLPIHHHHHEPLKSLGRKVGTAEEEEWFLYQRAQVHVFMGEFVGWWSRDMTDLVSMYLAPVPDTRYPQFSQRSNITSYEIAETQTFRHNLVPSTGLFFSSIRNGNQFIHYMMHIEIINKIRPIRFRTMMKEEHSAFANFILILARRWRTQDVGSDEALEELAHWISATDRFETVFCHFLPGVTAGLAIVELSALREIRTPTGQRTVRPAIKIWQIYPIK